MRNIIWFVLLFGVAVLAATTLGTNDGLATFYWRGWRLDVSLTADGRTCTVARSAAAWQREVRGRRVIAIVDSLEKVACGTRCSPFE